jgi:hypothetical protein
MDFRPDGTSNKDLTTDVRVQVTKEVKISGYLKRHHMEKQIPNNSTASKCFRFLFRNLLSNLSNQIIIIKSLALLLLISTSSKISKGVLFSK